MITELAPFGDLLGFLRRSRGLQDSYYNIGNLDQVQRMRTTLSPDELMSFAWQIADGMSYLGSKQVILYDLICDFRLPSPSLFGVIGRLSATPRISGVYRKRIRHQEILTRVQSFECGLAFILCSVILFLYIDASCYFLFMYNWNFYRMFQHCYVKIWRNLI